MARKYFPFLCVAAMLVGSVLARAQFVITSRAVDPGVRGGTAGAGGPFGDLTPGQLAFFEAGLEDFEEVEDVPDGLGPTMNLDSCQGCHAQPATGGTSPFVNPQVAFATAFGATNRLPPFITLNGPVREARFVRLPNGDPDGGVHALFTIAGRSDAPGCTLAQPDFDAALANRNVIFRTPTPVFGLGLVEQISDNAIRANLADNAAEKRNLGIRGEVNTNGNDGTITRFGWKAQNKSLMMFSGEAYNVEMGISNELFQTERNERRDCQFSPTPNDVTNTETEDALDVSGGVERFAVFMRFSAPPEASATLPGGATSIRNGRQVFDNVGCAHCHTPTLRTGDSTVASLHRQAVNLFSDLAIHDMGPLLADGVSQGRADGRQFRTAPLWGLGQRIFFLHDGRTRNLLSAIQAHQSGNPFGRDADASEAYFVIQRFNSLTERQKQDLLNFLRSL